MNLESIFNNTVVEVIQVINFIATILLIIGFHIIIHKDKARVWNLVPILTWAYFLAMFYILRLLSLHGYFTPPYPLFFTTLSSLLRFQLTMSLLVEVIYLLVKYRKMSLVKEIQDGIPDTAV
jgi:hypothetical protein